MSEDRGGHIKSDLLDIRLPRNLSSSQSIATLEVWAMALSCIKNITDTTHETNVASEQKCRRLHFKRYLFHNPTIKIDKFISISTRVVFLGHPVFPLTYAMEFRAGTLTDFYSRVRGFKSKATHEVKKQKYIPNVEKQLIYEINKVKVGVGVPRYVKSSRKKLFTVYRHHQMLARVK